MSLVLRLDVPALERLIGGDSEVEIQLRQGVVEEFTRRHLLAVLKDKAFAEFLSKEAEVARQGLDALVQERIGTVKSSDFGSRLTVYLTENIKTALTTEAERRISEYVKKTIEEVWTSREKRIITEVQKTITERTNQLTEKLVQELVQQRLNKIAAEIKADQE